MHSTTLALYAAIGRGITALDDGTLRSWLDGPGSLLGEVDDVVRDTDLPGWAAELSCQRTHRHKWTGQFVGVVVPDGLTDEQACALLTDRPSTRRGTPQSIVFAAQQTLTGSKSVTLLERTTSAYALTVYTFSTETPDAAATEAAIRAAKPAGLVLTYQSVSPTSYTALEGEAAVTYTALEGESAQTYTVLES